MGDAAIYYWPDGDAGTLETIDFAEPLTTLELEPKRERFSTRTLVGRQYDNNVSFAPRIRVTCERFTGLTGGGKGLARDLLSLASHLERGQSIIVCEDTAKAWAAFSRTSQARGNTGVYTDGLLMSSVLAGGLAAADEVRFIGGYPSHNRELHKVTSWSSPLLTLTRGLRYSYDDEPILIQERGTWVAMKVPPDALGRPILTHDSRLTYSFEAVLEMDWGVVAAMHEQQGGYNDADSGHGITMDGAAKIDVDRGFQVI